MIFQGISTCDISDTWASLNDPSYPRETGGFIPHLKSMNCESTFHCEGFIYTAKYETCGSSNSPAIPKYPSDLAPPGSMLFIQVPAETRNAIWGGLHHFNGERRGISGVVTNGFVRDLSELKVRGVENGPVPVWASGASVLSAKGRIALTGVQVELTDFRVSISNLVGVTVRPGDYAVSDENGVIVISKQPAHSDDEFKTFLEGVRKTAAETMERDERIKEALKTNAGLEINEAFKKFR